MSKFISPPKYSPCHNNPTMSSVLQLLVDYYKAVLESDRIYNEAIRTDPINEEPKEISGNIAPKIANETLLLQRQLTDLTSQLQDLKRKNEALQEQQKSYKALNESKIAKFKRTIESLKKKNVPPKKKKKKGDEDIESEDAEDQYVTDDNESDKKKFDYHLLSPVAKRGLKRALKISNGNRDNSISSSNNNNNSNSSNKKGTIFDSKKETFSDDDESTDDSTDSPSKTIRRPRMEHEESFLKSFDTFSQSTNSKSESSSTKKRKVKQLDNVDIPSLNDFSRDEDDEDENEPDQLNTPKKKSVKLNLKKSPPLKKRKLIRKKIEKFNENGDDSLNKDSMEKSV